MNAGPSGVAAVANTIEQHQGRITVDMLAKEHNLTTRTLERQFARNSGMSPKLFINIIKFKYACQRIRQNDENDSLMQIAYEMGYYDHSHLTRDIKRFSGLNPSDIGTLAT